jgi:tripartite-type tricarboxylate transporter receptor subunit TctC
MIKIPCRITIGVTRAFWAALALSSIAVFSQEALAQTYPNKPMRIVVGTTPGGSPDIVARLVAGKLTEIFGQQVIVDNRAGGGGRIAAEVAARSASDGYTLLLLTSQHTCINAMYKDLKYNIVKDFAPISLVGAAPSALVINPSVPVTSIKELVTLAKSRPGSLRYGSGGTGSSSHLPAVILKSMTGIDILHVPYKSGPASLTGTLTGEVDMYFTPLAPCMPMIKAGKLRALGVTSTRRTPLAPDFPSISETIPGYEFMSWQSLVAPAKTPPAILAKLSSEIVRAMNSSVVREQMMTLGYEPQVSTQQGLALYISEQLEKMSEAVKLSGARLED